MAYITVKYESEAIQRHVAFEMFLPNDRKAEHSVYYERPMKTLFLLHGYHGTAWNWIPEELPIKYNFAVVCPNGENSFWLDGLSTGHKFCTHIGEEIPDYLCKTFGLANSADDTYIMGLSMGGFGALHTALVYPERFGKVGAMSSAFVTRQLATIKPGFDDGMANFDYYRECFGEPSEIPGSVNDPEALVDKLLAAGVKLPELYLCCGTEDFLLENNREMHDFLDSRNVKHEYIETPGGHDMTFWNEHGTRIIRQMFDN